MAPPQEGGGGDLLEAGLLASAAPNGGGKQETTSSSGRVAPPQRRRVWRRAVAQLREVLLGTRLFPLFSAVPLAVAAENLRLGRVRVACLPLSLCLCNSELINS